MPILTPLPCLCPPPETPLSCETDSVTVCETAAESAVVTSVPAAVATTTLSLSDPTRRGLAIYNNSSSEMFIKLGAGATSTSFTFRAGTNSYFEVPFNYTGLVTGFWTTANGAALVTEVFN